MTTSPRVDLVAAPTPLHALPTLTAERGGPRVLVKREDLAGIGGGGNKLRKLEYVLARAVATGADTIVTIGAHESNHVRATAAAAARHGLACIGLLVDETGVAPTPNGGNRFLASLFGARLVHLPRGTDYEAALAGAAAEVRAAGRVPFVVPAGGSTAEGCLGARDLAVELGGQLRELGVEPSRIVLATGTGGTLAGLAAGADSLPGRPVLHGVSVGAPRARQRARVEARLHTLVDLLPDLDVVRALDRVVIDDAQIGPGYGVPTEASCAAVSRLARREGLLLDPIYTGKAMAGLLAEIEAGRVRPGEVVVFVHTGGAPSLPAYQDHFGRAPAGGQGEHAT
ncbi:1-aminocyclopropane-1-carboxylate deaminase/D-cysteine desulfhydrase [Salinarimonas ramus]|uniref:1-aminocyclopropane-1-carboxylate deaminase n=1 Tax=Salinarimonas ramus TaxID=690164 RepID=A0A917V9Z5_9HYPH|nr:pyridoxal-phosphate dependent enzyme [Salinarimonas ramus]GGK53123.1 1-aminocyclopropane-1-carboxylate deaminase [Salinarimonas ramus]